MGNYTGLLITMAIVVSWASAAGAYTVTFDEVAPGTNPQNYQDTSTPFCPGPEFAIEDHSNASWGPPRSGTNVMVCEALGGEIRLIAGPFGSTDLGTPINAVLFGAYFSTPPGAEVMMTLYKRATGGLSPLASMIIGSQNEAWSNQYVSYASPTGDIYDIRFDLWSLPMHPSATPGLFCVDDMTITPVPEPSSLAALVCGLAGVAGIVVRRRPSAEQGRM